MKTGLRQVDHASTRKHRRQLWTQILLPVIVAVLVFSAVIALLSVATFRNNGDVGRWAAISTIWLVIPVMMVSLILVVLLGAMIYLLGWVTHIIPPYSYQAQRFARRVEAGVRRTAEIAHRPALILREIGTFMKTTIRKARERM
jgi:FtsH-binding integral membrane protein